MIRRWLSSPALAAALLLIYAVVLFSNVSRAVGGSDSSGYANAARLIARGQVVVPILPLDMRGVPSSFDRVFIPLAFVPGPAPRTMTPFYPVGFPLHQAALSKLIGWELGPYVVSPLLALGSVCLIFLVARELGLSHWYALSGAALLGVCAVFVFQALQPMADVAATFWSLAAIAAALRSRRKPGWSAASGLAFGVAILIRPTNAVLLPALLFALPLRVPLLLLFAAGGLPTALFFGLYNAAAFGHPFKTGYSALGLREGFRWANFSERFGDYTTWLARMLTPFPLLGWFAVSADRRVNWRDRAMLLCWFGGFLVLYCLYDVYGTWWYTRYLLPGLPAVILAFLLVLRDAAARWKWRPAVVAILLAAILGWAVSWDHRIEVLGADEGQAIHRESCLWAATLLPEKAAVVSMDMSGSLRYYSGRLPARWDWIEAAEFPRLRGLVEEAGYRWYALLIAHEVSLAAPRVPGRWSFVGEKGPISLWRLEPGAGP